MLEIPAEATVVLLAYSKLDFYPKGAVEHSACYGWILLLCPPEFLMKTQDNCHNKWERNWLGQDSNGQDTQICAVNRKKANYLQGKSFAHQLLFDARPELSIIKNQCTSLGFKKQMVQ